MPLAPFADTRKGLFIAPPLRASWRSGGGGSAKPEGLVSLTEGAAARSKEAPSVADYAATPPPLCRGGGLRRVVFAVFRRARPEIFRKDRIGLLLQIERGLGGGRERFY